MEVNGRDVVERYVSGQNGMEQRMQTLCGRRQWGRTA